MNLQILIKYTMLLIFNTINNMNTGENYETTNDFSSGYDTQVAQKSPTLPWCT